MPDGFCEVDDVKHALQKADLKGVVSSTYLEPAIHAASEWFANLTNTHWYDSGGSASDLVPTSAATSSNVRLDVPSSPHRQDHQLTHDEPDVRYPVTRNGPYARITLPHPYVTSLSKLEVRQFDGSVEDWVAASDVSEGRGEAYYVEQEGQDSYGRTHLYVRAAEIGPRVDYGGLLTLEYEFGLDAQDGDWSDVRRGIAALAAAQSVDDDNVLSQIPDNGQLVGVDTQAQNLLDQASKYLDPHIARAVE